MRAQDAMTVRLGVDVGGTNTDAVVLHGSKVKGAFKHGTSNDVVSSVQKAITAALQSCSTDAKDVSACMLGTTHFVNACVQRTGLAEVAVFRLCGPATHALPPFCDLPGELRDIVGGQYELLDGGLEYDGGTEISPIYPKQIQRATAKALSAGITSVVVSGIFAPVNSSQEEAAAAIIKEHGKVQARYMSP